MQLIVDALDDRRAKDIAVLDLQAASETLDYFIVATGESSVQLKALEDRVRERGYTLVLGNSDYDPERERSYLDLVRSNQLLRNE